MDYLEVQRRTLEKRGDLEGIIASLNSVHTTVLRIAVKGIPSHEKLLHAAAIVALHRERGFWLLIVTFSACLGEVLQLLKSVLDSSLSQMGTAQQRSLENSLLWSQPLQLGEWSTARVGQFSSLFV